MPRIIFLAALAAACYAQSAATGALEGTVRNSAGQPIAAVSVTIIHPATNESRSAATGAAGTFRFSLLTPGVYRLEFRAAGFRPAVFASVSVNVSETPNVTASLTAGNGADPVPCDCRVAAASPSTGTLVDQRTITAVPLNTRNFTQVLSMSSGSAADVNNAGTLGRGTQNVNVNGNTSAGSYTIDGAWAPSTVPNPDTISEFKIQTSQYDSVYGAYAPPTNLLTRRGENDLHGDLWEFLRNDVFNSNAFFRNSTGQPKPNLKQNQFGATAGGAVRRNKLFYFGSYQGTRQVNGLDPTSISNLILPVLTSGRSGAAIAAAFCPANHPGDSRFLTFAGGKQLDCNNASTETTAPVSPVALRLLQARGANGQYLIPDPQTLITSGANSGLGFSTYSLPSTYNEHQYLGNADYIVSPKHTLAARVFTATIAQVRTFGSPNGYPGAPIVPGWGSAQRLSAVDLATSVKLTSSLSANVVNEATATYTRNNTNAVGDGTPSAASFGMTAVDPLFPQASEITVLGALGSFRLFGTNPNDNHFRTVTYTAADNLSFVRGSHRMRTGGYFLSQYNGRADTGGARGKITFQTFSDFLVGLSAAANLSPAGRSNVQTVQASEGVGPNGEVEYRYRRYNGAAFLQDDWKLSSRFTLNAGLRWEYIGPSLDEAGVIGNMSLALLRKTAIPTASGTLVGNTVPANYDPALKNPYTGKAFGAPPDGVTVRSSKSFYDNGTPLTSFAPRAGFAWQPSTSIVVGGGYGWFYQAPLFSANASSAPLFTSAPFAQGFTNTDASNGTASFEQPFPATTLGYVPRTLTSQLSDRVAGPEYRVPLLQQWNTSVRLRAGHGFSIDVAYVGTLATRLLLARGLNQPLLASATSPVNCGYTGNAADCVTTNTSRNARQRVPILGETPTALLTSEYTGRSNYHSFQTTVRRQLTGKLSFQAAYTMARALTNISVMNDQNNPDASRARPSFDRTHRLIANFDYPLPVASHNRLWGGWSIAGIAILQSGLPLTFTDPAGGAVYGRAGTSTITLCPGATYQSLATEGSVTARLSHWVDTRKICAPVAVGSDGATGYGTAGLSIVNGPGQVNTDFSIGKRTRVGGLREDGELAFRVEFYNALNHPQFSNPGTTLGTATFGVITQTSVAPRLIQFGLKYLF